MLYYYSMYKINPKFVSSLLLLLFLPLVSTNAAGEVFEFNHKEGDRYRILSVVKQEVLVNGFFSHRAEILNRIAVETTGETDGKWLHKAIFQTSERLVYDLISGRQAGSSGFQWSREYESVFERDKLGRLTIDPKYYMPVVRNVPVFPEKNLNVGDKWYAEAYEVHDFRDAFGIEEPYKIPFNAFYEYVGERQWKDVSYPSFTVTYNIESRPPPVRGLIYPMRISGTFNQLFYWDHALGQTVAYNENYRIIFIMSDGRRIEFRGTAQAEFVEAENMDREQLASEIQEEIERMDIKDVNVKVVDEGISLSLEDIRFYADSDRMLPGEEAKLAGIAEILKRYPERDILVSGHAALRGTPEYLLDLSQKRARAIADYLLSENIRSADRIVIRGYGAERPIADNVTEEGMRRNRRVEITILEN